MSNKDTKRLKELGQKIRKVRQSKGYSQDRMYLEAGFSRATMSRIERGLVNPTYITLTRIAETLNIGVKDLMP